MNKYLIWVRVNDYQTAKTIVYAENALAAKLLAEASLKSRNVCF